MMCKGGVDNIVLLHHSSKSVLVMRCDILIGMCREDDQGITLKEIILLHHLGWFLCWSSLLTVSLLL